MHEHIEWKLLRQSRKIAERHPFRLPYLPYGDILGRMHSSPLWLCPNLRIYHKYLLVSYIIEEYMIFVSIRIANSLLFMCDKWELNIIHDSQSEKR